MTVAENVQMALISRNGRTRALVARCQPTSTASEALALLERVGLGADADRPCSELAYGDVKRVELAIALAGAPKLLLMDEPTAGMAPKERAQLMQLVAGIAREQRARRALHRARHGQPCLRTPTTSSCWCAARSSPPAGRRRCAATPACARSIWAAAPAPAAGCAGRRGERS